MARGDAEFGRRGRSEPRPYEETATAAGSIARNCCVWDAVRRFHGKIKGGAATMAETPTLPINREGSGTRNLKPSEKAAPPAPGFRGPVDPPGSRDRTLVGDSYQVYSGEGADNVI